MLLFSQKIEAVEFVQFSKIFAEVKENTKNFIVGREISSARLPIL